MQRKRAHQHDDRNRQQRKHNHPPTTNGGASKRPDLRDPFLGHSTRMRLRGLHQNPFRFRDGIIGKPCPAIGINQMQRRRKAILAMFDHPLHALDCPSRKPYGHKDDNDRKHDHRA